MACRCLRVDQLDAHVLDDEIRNIAQSSVDDVINQLPVRVGRVFEKMRPEVKTTIEAILWSHRYFAGCSPGQEQMDISYQNYTPRRVSLHFLVSVLVPYLGSRISQFSGKIELMRIYTKLEAIFEACSILHFILFLRNGGHSTIAESILSLRNWNNNQPTIANVNYDTQNRELIWHAFRDVILLVYPLINIFKTKIVKQQKLGRKLVKETSRQVLDCGVCDKPSVIPMVGKICRHVACYTCVTSSTASSEMTCPICEYSESDTGNHQKEMIFVVKDEIWAKIN